ncbi:MAG: stalk domain-containing protein [Armatimonadota bacterium]
MTVMLHLVHNHWRCSVTFRLLFLLVVLAILPVHAYCVGMALAVESAKTRYLVDEPLVLTITLKNASKKQIELPVILHPEVGYFTLYIREPGGKPKVYHCGVSASMMLPKRGKIFVPGEAASTRMWLASYFSDGASLLSKPGTYTFFARYTLSKEFPGGPVALRSADIHVQVSPPANDEQQAHELLLTGKTGFPWRYPQPSPHAKQEMAARMDRFARLVRQYPHSVYALYAQAQYAIDLAGLSFLEQGATRQERITYLTKSREQYRIFAALAKGTPHEAEALLGYGRALARLREIEQASSAFEAALLCPSATTEERIQSLSWTRLLEAGIFREHLTEDGEKYPLPERTFPLVASARVLGFHVEWDGPAKTAMITNPRVKALLRVGSNTITINGKKQSGALSVMAEKDQVRVSVRTLGYLLQVDPLIKPVLP